MNLFLNFPFPPFALSPSLLFSCFPHDPSSLKDHSILYNICPWTKDLVYWTRQYVDTTEDAALCAWREIIEAKLVSNPGLHTLFCDKIFKYNKEEAQYWVRKLNYIPPGRISPSYSFVWP